MVRREGANLGYRVVLAMAVCSLLSASDDFDDFMDVLEETTKIATKNKVGADYAPGIITILTSEELERLGVKDFYEALEFVTGVDVDVNKVGTRNLVIRGVGGLAGSGKTKVLIDGIEQNSGASGLIHFSLPTALIDRIEIIRGPASALYGEYAFSGVINIITKRNQSMISYRADSTSNLYSAIASYSDDDISVNALVSYNDEYGYSFNTTDFQGNTKKVEANRDERSLTFNVEYGDFSIQALFNEAQKGEYFGVSNLLPTPDDEENYRFKYRTVEAKYTFELNKALLIEPKVGYFEYDYYFNYLTMAMPMTLEADDKYAKKYAGVDAFYNVDTHAFLVGVEYSKMEELERSVRMHNLMQDVVQTEQTDKSLMDTRDLFALYLQDNITLNSRLSVNIGLRYDNYDDKINEEIDARFSPRVAGIYELDTSNIFKLQYSEAFRAPSFHEQTMDAKIESETNKMVEFEHIWKHKNYSLKSILYYATIDNLIVPKNSMNYQNEEETITSKGAEVEAYANFSNNLLLKSNFSYADATYDKSGKDVPNYANLLANVALSYKPYSRFSSTVWARYVGSKHRWLEDSRDRLAESKRVDISFKYVPHTKNFKMTFGVKNIFNEYIHSISDAQSYEDDLFVQKRRYFMDLSYIF